MIQILTDEDIELIRDKATASFKRHKCSVRGQQITDADDPDTHLIWATESAVMAKLREQEHVYWTHSCNVLCLDNVELWIDRCPHCGKPSPFGVTK